MATVLGIDCGGGSGRRNIGTEPCLVTYGRKTGHIQVLKGTTYPIASAFDKDFWNTEVQQGRARFIGGAFGVTTEVGSPTLQTGDLQVSAVTARPLPVVTTIIQKGYEWHTGGYTMSGQDLYDVFDIYQNNIIKGAISIDGTTISGFSVSMYEVGTWQDATADAGAQSTVTYQYDDLYQYNVLGIAITNLNFNANKEINNIVDVNTTGRADISDNKIYVKTPWLANPSRNISGFAAANFRLLLNGVVDPISGTVVQNATTLEWAITPTTAVATGQSWVVELYDAVTSPNVAVAKVGTTTVRFYKGETPAIVPVA